MPTSPDARQTGTLTVVVTTAGGALPVPGAQVTVRSLETDGFLRRLQTDENGRTPTLILETPPVANSLVPGGVRPYAVYNVIVEKDDFYTSENREVPLFSGVNSVQPVELLPRPPYESEEIQPMQDTVFSAGQQLS